MTEIIAIREVRKNQFRVKYLCDYCGIRANDRKSHFDRKKLHFCSQECYSAYRTEIMEPEQQNSYGRGNTPEERAKRRKARSDLNHAIDQGSVKRESCEVCGKDAEAHHDDYDKPLEVRWLCFAHHRKHHKPIYKNPELLK